MVQKPEVSSENDGDLKGRYKEEQQNAQTARQEEHPDEAEFHPEGQ